ncbi:hypothetical protein A0H81_10405 [Grifola frondosa]|uniref:Uncharacterized protein n=1 Tax=Grifola frondosa TaxID=5627 RepID=A0A1C7M3Y4_GRIFR|nr:hypothetical protein A0H81_10405 [Grifola frondosa]
MYGLREWTGTALRDTALLVALWVPGEWTARRMRREQETYEELDDAHAASQSLEAARTAEWTERGRSVELRRCRVVAWDAVQRGWTGEDE